MKRKKTPKVKIDKIELNLFSYESLVIDSYWDDLYNPKEKPIKHLYDVKHKKRIAII